MVFVVAGVMHNAVGSVILVNDQMAVGGTTSFLASVLVSGEWPA